MGKQKYQEKIMNLFEKSPVVDFKSVERIINEKHGVKQYAKQVVKNLIKQGKINRLGKGVYTKHNESSLAVFLFRCAYLGLQDALSFHNLWEQETIPIIITKDMARTGIRKILGSNVMIRRIDKKYFFGFEYHREGNFVLLYSDIEKTIIDLVYFNQNISEEALKNIKRNINKRKLNKYLNKYPLRFQKRVMEIIN